MPAALALLGNYMAGSFALAAGGGTLISGTPQTEPQLLLARPQGCSLDKPAAKLLAVNV